MDFDREWTQFAVDAEVEHYGTKRLTEAHNSLRSELERLRKNTGWKPIDGAPRDGTVVELWHRAGYKMVDQWWDDDEGIWVGGMLPDDEFTHFMIPPIPQEMEA
jgi:hypothetical protein